MKFSDLQTTCENRTLLGVGPVSKNTVDVTIEVANEFGLPLLLIPSRRQIECKELGGGYVNQWTTEEFATYVKSQSGENLLLARDHGGPWQGANENELNAKDALDQSFKSYFADIDAGFDILHIDTSFLFAKGYNKNEVLSAAKKIYDACEAHAAKTGKELIYELGTEEHTTNTTNPKYFYELLDLTKELPKVKFLVGNTGTFVRELSNKGFFNERGAFKMAQLCTKNGLFLKEHNVDYLRRDFLEKHPGIGIHSANIAPEFGTTETKEFLKLLLMYNMTLEFDEFTKLCFESRKWEKWMIAKDSTERGVRAAVICGHYLFTHPKFLEIKDKLNKKMNVDRVLKREIRRKIEKYLKAFLWIQEEIVSPEAPK